MRAGGRKPWKTTPAIIEQIVALREAGGKTARASAIRRIILRDHGVAISRKHIDLICILQAAEAPHLANTPVRATRLPMVYQRNGKTVRRFTPEEDAQLIALEGHCLSYAEIARRLRRAPRSCALRLTLLARQQERAAAAADTGQQREAA
jgi:hypothetical protein